MTVKELKELLNILPENAEVVLCDDDFNNKPLMNSDFSFFKKDFGYCSIKEKFDEVRIDI